MNKLKKQSILALVIALTYSLSVEAVSVPAFPEHSKEDYSEQFSEESYYNYGIRDFNSLLEIQKDSSIIVTEEISVDFTNASNRHGLIRSIPMKYRDAAGNFLNLHFKLISVTDPNNQPIDYSYSFNDPNADIKIGSADQYVDGKVVYYKIKYQIDRGLNRFEGYDELFWNTTGNANQSAIANSTTYIVLPQPVDEKLLQSKCFTGFEGSSAQDCTTKVINGQVIEYKTNSLLRSGEGISVLLGFPKDLITYPSPVTYFLWFLADNWGFGVPMLVFAFMYFQWYTKGRDPVAAKSTVMAEYEAPDNLRPAQIGTLIDDSMDMRDITSTIIDLATRGYLKIIEKKEKKFLGESTTYTLEKTTQTNAKESLADFESKVYDGLFGSATTVTLDDLRYKFYKVIPDIKKAVYTDLVSKKYYASNPESVRTAYVTTAAIIFFGTIFFAEIVIAIMPSLMPGLLISAVIIGIFGNFMPKKTQKGVDTKVHILGLEEFIRTAEKDRMKFYEQENIFEKMLPYAIALNLAEKWAKACEGLNIQQPSWYQSSNPNFGTNFSTNMFLHSLNDFSNTANTNMTVAPRSSSSSGVSGFSSGGGFSGGGFGGGGSSSW